MENFQGEYNFEEELITLKSESMSMNDPPIHNNIVFDFDYLATANIPPTNYSEIFSSHDDFQPSTFGFNGFYTPFRDELLPPADSSFNNLDNTLPFLSHEDFSIINDENHNAATSVANYGRNFDGFDLGMLDSIHSDEMPKFDLGSFQERLSKSKNSSERQPSKNLMAERRRRKRLNDRLSMLRSVVPKISKMDRTAILGDTIDYMKELMERIKYLQNELDVGSNLHPNYVTIFKDVNPNKLPIKNSPKFDVERRNIGDTKVEICCVLKPGLLLSTLTTLEALGLEIQQCIISCFNDFTLHASCFEEKEQREILSSEDVKQELAKNFGI